MTLFNWTKINVSNGFNSFLEALQDKIHFLASSSFQSALIP